jgi:hypothetical protein
LKTFRSLVVLKRPHTELWSIMRDHLTDVAPQIADIDEIRLLERREDQDGVVRMVNQWHARHQVPAAIRSILKAGELGWIDRNTWDTKTLTCSWTVEPNILPGYIACSGQTIFTAAMAGQGARVTFEGGLDVRPGVLGGSLGGIEKLVSGFLESVVTTVIPRNLRAVVEAAAAFELPK